MYFNLYNISLYCSYRNINDAFVGKGTYKWKETGTIYDGDWKKGKRNGFGTYSRPDAKKKGAFVKEYSGGWKNDMRHV